MPSGARVRRKAVAEYVGPGADDLPVDALLVEPNVPLRDRLDQPRKERPDLEPVIEMQRRRGAGRARQTHPDVLSARVDCIEQLRRNVVGVNVNRHAEKP